MERLDPTVTWVFFFFFFYTSQGFNILSTHVSWQDNIIFVWQHAPYDAMVLVTMCWYVDQKIQSTGGKWKVVAITGLASLKTSTNDILIFQRDRTQSDSCHLPRSWCLPWMKKSGVTSAMPNNNTMSRWVCSVRKRETLPVWPPD